MIFSHVQIAGYWFSVFNLTQWHMHQTDELLNNILTVIQFNKFFSLYTLPITRFIFRNSFSFYILFPKLQNLNLLCNAKNITLMKAKSTVEWGGEIPGYPYLVIRSTQTDDWHSQKEVARSYTERIASHDTSDTICVCN